MMTDKKKKQIEKEFFSTDSGTQDTIIDNYQHRKHESWMGYNEKGMSDEFAEHLQRKGFGKKKMRRL